MKENRDTIETISKEGKERIEREIQVLKERLKNEFKIRNFDHSKENVDRESFLLEIAKISKEISDKMKILENSRVMKDVEANPNLVNIGDIVYLELIYAPDDVDSNYFHLIAGGQPEFDENGFLELSTKCAVGASILGKPINSTTYCTVENNNLVKIKIGNKYVKEANVKVEKIKTKSKN